MTSDTIYAVEIAFQRTLGEEGYREKPYNDASGEEVTCRPDGNLTWLYGLNLETSGSKELGQLIMRWWYTNLHNQLIKYSWYAACNSQRKSVLLDVAYNEGLESLLEFHNMINALSLPTPNYDTASVELLNSKAATEEPHRYIPLANIMRLGVISAVS